jgi:hypothetical protein
VATMTLIHVLNGELYQHVPEALLAVMELVPAHKDLNGIALEAAAHIPAILIQVVSHLVLMNVHIPDKNNV